MKNFFTVLCVLTASCFKMAVVYYEGSGFISITKSQIYSQIILTGPEDISKELRGKDYGVVIDMTRSMFISINLQEMCLDNGISYFKGYYEDNGEVILAYRPEAEVVAIRSLLEQLQIKAWALVYSLEFLQDYKEFIETSRVRVPVSSTISPEQLIRHLDEVKYSEVNTVVILLNGPLTALLLKVLSMNSMSGYALILSEKADYLPYSYDSSLERQGAIRLSLTTGEQFLDYITKIFSDCENNEYQLCLNALDLTNNHLPDRFYVLNTQNLAYKVIGKCDPTCMLTDKIMWPIGAENATSGLKPLRISYEGSLNDPLGNYLDFLIPAYQGIELSIDYINNHSSVFVLKPYRLNFGGLYYNKSYVENELSHHTKDLGSAMISPAMSDLTLNLYNTLTNSSIRLPTIGYSNTVSLLSSIADFPLYSRVCMPDSYQAVIIPIMIKFFGWTRVGVLYIDNLFSSTLYSGFLEEANKYNIEILNKVNNKLPGNSASWTNSDIDPMIIDLGLSEARIIIVFCYTNEITAIVLRMKELGYYGMDYEYIAVGWLVNELLNPTEPNINITNLEIVREALTGSLMFFPVSFIKDFGEEIKKLYLTKYGSAPVGYTSFAFDSVLAISAAFDTLISAKKDYENPTMFMQALRAVKFEGTTGTVTIQNDMNDRSPMDHFIVNTQKVDDSRWDVKIIGLFSPASNRVFTFYENITWPGEEIPLDHPIISSCPFNVKDNYYSNTGIGALTCVVVVVILLTFLAVLTKWELCKEVNCVMLNDKKREITFGDILNISRIVVEFFQYIGLLPSLPLILAIFKTVGSAISLNLESIYSLDSNVYWRIYQLVLCFTGFIIISRLLYCFKVKIPFIALIMQLSCDIFYISILSTLLNIYLCYEVNIFPFLHYDCYTICWKGEHLAYVCLNSIILVIYCYLVVHEKPKWTNCVSKENNIYLMPSQGYIRSIIQCILVCLKKFIWAIGVWEYTILIPILIACKLLISLKIPPYNSQIINMWSLISQVGVIIVCLVSIISETTDSVDSPIWLVIILMVWSGLLIAGFVIQKYKGYIWPFVTDKLSSELLKFAFQKSQVPEKCVSPKLPIDFTFRPNINI